MGQAEVRIIQSQEVVTNINDASQAEVNALLAKYGYTKADQNINITQSQAENNLSFEDMVRIQEADKKAEEQRRNMMNGGHNPVSFDPGTKSYSETRYGYIDDTNFGIEISIVSDMKIQRY